jgi:Terminase RNaseH-like domain
MSDFTIGVDLGQSFDPTAIAVVRKLRPKIGDPIFQVGHLERLRLQTPYPGVVSHVIRMLAQLPEGTELVLDYTGVGKPVYDLFHAKGMSPYGVSITSGNAVTKDKMHYSVPKLTLISTVQALLHDGRLKIHKDLADVQVLVAELQDFRAEVTDSGYWRFGARAGKHDDLVLALAIALWHSVGRDATTGIIDYYRWAVESDRMSAAGVIPDDASAVRMKALARSGARAVDATPWARMALCRYLSRMRCHCELRGGSRLNMFRRPSNVGRLH